MIDRDLAELYGVTTKRLNEQVKRNIKRFPTDFMYQLTQKEKDDLVAICDHLKSLKFSSQLPNVFTEHGAVMLASVLNNDRAIEVNIQIVRIFTKMRELLTTGRTSAAHRIPPKGRIELIHSRDCRQQLLRIIRPRPQIHLLRLSHLLDPPFIHDHDPVTDIPDHR